MWEKLHTKRTKCRLKKTQCNKSSCEFGGRIRGKGLAATLCARSPIQSLMRMIICGSWDDPDPRPQPLLPGDTTALCVGILYIVQHRGTPARFVPYTLLITQISSIVHILRYWTCSPPSGAASTSGYATCLQCSAQHNWCYASQNKQSGEQSRGNFILSLSNSLLFFHIKNRMNSVNFSWVCALLDPSPATIPHVLQALPP